MDEQVLFLSRLEFAVLLLTEGITEILCFPLPNIEVQEIEEKQMIETIYELVCMGCLQVNETSVKLTDSMEKRIKGIKEAEQYLIIEPGELSYPQKIAYIGERIVVLEYVQKEGKVFRLFSMEKQEFWKWLEDSMAIPEVLIKERTEANQIVEYSELAIKEREKLTECIPKEEQTLSEWMEQIETVLQETVYWGMECIGKQKSDTVQKLLLGQGVMNLWFLWYRPKEDITEEENKKSMDKSEQNILQIEPDSLEFRKKIADRFWREKQ